MYNVYITAVMCEENFDLQNGIVINGDGPFSVNDMVEFKCNEGFELDGATVIVCQNDATFSDMAPECIGKCLAKLY